MEEFDLAWAKLPLWFGIAFAIGGLILTVIVERML